jgi:hypothetical protein
MGLAAAGLAAAAVDDRGRFGTSATRVALVGSLVMVLATISSS